MGWDTCVDCKSKMFVWATLFKIDRQCSHCEQPVCSHCSESGRCRKCHLIKPETMASLTLDKLCEIPVKDLRFYQKHFKIPGEASAMEKNELAALVYCHMSHITSIKSPVNPVSTYSPYSSANNNRRSSSLKSSSFASPRSNVMKGSQGSVANPSAEREMDAVLEETRRINEKIESVKNRMKTFDHECAMFKLGGYGRIDAKLLKERKEKLLLVLERLSESITHDRRKWKKIQERIMDVQTRWNEDSIVRMGEILRIGSEAQQRLYDLEEEFLENFEKERDRLEIWQNKMPSPDLSIGSRMIRKASLCSSMRQDDSDYFSNSEHSNRSGEHQPPRTMQDDLNATLQQQRESDEAQRRYIEEERLRALQEKDKMENVKKQQIDLREKQRLEREKADQRIKEAREREMNLRRGEEVRRKSNVSTGTTSSSYRMSSYSNVYSDSNRPAPLLNLTQLAAGSSDSLSNQIHDLTIGPRSSRFLKDQSVSLDDIESEQDIQLLTAKQLKDILKKNRVDLVTCVEKQDFAIKVTDLWREHKKFEEKEKLLCDAEGDGATEGDECIICYEKQANCVFLNCGHMVTCVDCGSVCKDCPICRSFIMKVVRVFRA